MRRWRWFADVLYAWRLRRAFQLLRGPSATKYGRPLKYVLVRRGDFIGVEPARDPAFWLAFWRWYRWLLLFSWLSTAQGSLMTCGEEHLQLEATATTDPPR